jgi:outer membrane protein OmpA-like peptidoglycan-associated protein
MKSRRSRTWLGSWLIAGGLAVAGLPAFAQGEPEESCMGKVRLRGPIWDLSTRSLEPGLDVVLDTVARTIRERCGTKSIVIESHAYEMPTPELNQRLSELRAGLVRHELVARGVPSGRLLPVGLGDTQPLIPLDEPDAALENRRITFRPLD